MLIRSESLYDKILLGNCEKILKNVPSGSIQLTVTSPPYGNAIDYDLHASKKSAENYRGIQKVSLDEYLEDMVTIFNNQVYRVTKEGGIAVL